MILNHGNVNFVLCNKIDAVKSPSIRDIDYQYRLLRVKAFVDNRDVIMAYVKDTEIDSFELENESNELRFQLPENRKFRKYNANNFICKSDNPLSIAVIGAFNFKTDDSILIDSIKLNEIDDLYSEDYDALFINSSISDGTVDELVKKNWDVYIIDPFKNLEPFGNTNIKENVIIIEKSLNGCGSSSKAEYYDLESNYFMAYNYIFERLSNRKE